MGKMASSAKLALDDAMSLMKKGDEKYAKERALKSLEYSVGIHHPDYQKVKSASILKEGIGGVDWLHHSSDFKVYHETDALRILVADHALVIQELPVPGKHKTKLWVASGHFGYAQTVYHLNDYIMTNILNGSKVKSASSYESAVQDVNKYLEKAAEDNKTKGHGLPNKLEEKQVYYLEIEPKDHSPMKVDGKDFTVSASWDRFSASSPDSDFQSHDPYYTKYVSKSAAAARKFYKMIKSEPDLLKGLSWDQFGNWLKSNAIPYDIHHSQWT